MAEEEVKDQTTRTTSTLELVVMETTTLTETTERVVVVKEASMVLEATEMTMRIQMLLRCLMGLVVSANEAKEMMTTWMASA